VVFVVVGIVVVLAIAGVILLAVRGLAQEDDPTLGAHVPSATAAPSATPVARATGAEPSPARTGSPASSSSADLASAVSESLGPGVDEDSGPQFDRKRAEERLADAAKRASACRPKSSNEQKGPAKVEVTFDPETGGVSQVRVFGRYSDTKTGNCITLTMKAIHVRKFSGGPVTLEQSVMVR
jgi:hypothetical protein